ncbi:hypothetical protein HK102_010476 [Quaeritorhiza haematococci]|nr:hypothetical protein HK102_010476 [Quaeritorhiza haematococci]
MFGPRSLPTSSQRQLCSCGSHASVHDQVLETPLSTILSKPLTYSALLSGVGRRSFVTNSASSVVSMSDAIAPEENSLPPREYRRPPMEKLGDGETPPAVKQQQRKRKSPSSERNDDNKLNRLLEDVQTAEAARKLVGLLVAAMEVKNPDISTINTRVFNHYLRVLCTHKEKGAHRDTAAPAKRLAGAILQDELLIWNSETVNILVSVLVKQANIEYVLGRNKADQLKKLETLIKQGYLSQHTSYEIKMQNVQEEMAQHQESCKTYVDAAFDLLTESWKPHRRANHMVGTLQTMSHGLFLLGDKERMRSIMDEWIKRPMARQTPHEDKPDLQQQAQAQPQRRIPALVYSDAIRTYMQAGDYEGAQKLFAEFRQRWRFGEPGFGMRPYEAMAEVHCRAGKLFSAMEVFHWIMRKDGLRPPGVSSYDFLLTGLLKAQDYQNAMSVFEGMHRGWMTLEDSEDGVKDASATATNKGPRKVRLPSPELTTYRIMFLGAIEHEDFVAASKMYRHLDFELVGPRYLASFAWLCVFNRDYDQAFDVVRDLCSLGPSVGVELGLTKAIVTGFMSRSKSTDQASDAAASDQSIGQATGRADQSQMLEKAVDMYRFALSKTMKHNTDVVRRDWAGLHVTVIKNLLDNPETVDRKRLITALDLQYEVMVDLGIDPGDEVRKLISRAYLATLPQNTKVTTPSTQQQTSPLPFNLNQFHVIFDAFFVVPQSPSSQNSYRPHIRRNVMTALRDMIDSHGVKPTIDTYNHVEKRFAWIKDEEGRVEWSKALREAGVDVPRLARHMSYQARFKHRATVSYEIIGLCKQFDYVGAANLERNLYSEFGIHPSAEAVGALIEAAGRSKKGAQEVRKRVEDAMVRCQEYASNGNPRDSKYIWFTARDTGIRGYLAAGAVDKAKQAYHALIDGVGLVTKHKPAVQSAPIKGEKKEDGALPTTDAETAPESPSSIESMLLNPETGGQYASLATYRQFIMAIPSSNPEANLSAEDASFVLQLYAHMKNVAASRKAIAEEQNRTRGAKEGAAKENSQPQKRSKQQQQEIKLRNRMRINPSQTPPQVYAIVLEALDVSGRYEEVWSVFRDMKEERHVIGPEMYEFLLEATVKAALQKLSAISSAEKAATEFSNSESLVKYEELEKRCLDMFAELLEDYPDLSEPANFNTILFLISEHQRWSLLNGPNENVEAADMDKIKRIWRLMAHHGVRPDRTSYSLYINALLDGGKVTDAVELLEAGKPTESSAVESSEAAAQKKNESGAALTAAHYHPVLAAVCGLDGRKSGSAGGDDIVRTMPAAIRILEDMVSKKIATQYSYFCVLAGLIAEGRVALAAKWRKSMDECKVTSSTAVENVLIAGHLKDHDFPSARAVFEHMLSPTQAHIEIANATLAPADSSVASESTDTTALSSTDSSATRAAPSTQPSESSGLLSRRKSFSFEAYLPDLHRESEQIESSPSTSTASPSEFATAPVGLLTTPTRSLLSYHIMLQGCVAANEKLFEEILENMEKEGFEKRAVVKIREDVLGD